MGTPAPEFVRSDAHLQPSGTATFQNTSSSSLVNPPPTFFFPKDSLISSRDPTLEQEQAIATLKDHPNSDIIAWHTLSRSTEPGLKHRNGPGGLSIQEIHAISTLRDCSREVLLHWLESAKQNTSPPLGLSIPRFSAAARSRQTQRQSSRPNQVSGHLSLVNSIRAASPNLSNNPYSALTTAHYPLAPVQKFSTASSHKTSALVRPANPDCIYWCTVCDNHSFRNSDGWKKHEKEHEIKYVCMLKGLFETTKDGQSCVLCGALNQADSHRLAHKAASCVQAVDRPSFKRRYDMVGHLKDAHDIPDGGDIADKWRYKSTKKAWSCGFCIRLFPSLRDRLKHIGTEHFEKGQSIKDWNNSKVIQGLLLQPGIKEAWQHLLDSLGPFRSSETKWNKLGSGDLQYRLERGPTGRETPQALAEAAYDSAEYDWSATENNTMASATTMNTIHNQYTNKALSPPFQNHAVASYETPVQYQSWSTPQHQASEIPRGAPPSDTQNSYGAPTPSFSHENLVPTLDYGPVWGPIASDTDDMNSTRPTTPFDDKFNPANPSVHTPWNTHNITPDPAHSDQEPFHYKSNDKIDWSAIPYPQIASRTIGSTFKRPRDSASPPAEPLRRKELSTDKPRQKAYRKRSEEGDTASQGFDLNDVQGRMYDDEGTPSEMRANGSMNDDL